MDIHDQCSRQVLTCVSFFYDWEVSLLLQLTPTTPSLSTKGFCTNTQTPTYKYTNTNIKYTYTYKYKYSGVFFSMTELYHFWSDWRHQCTFLQKICVKYKIQIKTFLQNNSGLISATNIIYFCTRRGGWFVERERGDQLTALIDIQWGSGLLLETVNFCRLAEWAKEMSQAEEHFQHLLLKTGFFSSSNIFLFFF